MRLGILSFLATLAISGIAEPEDRNRRPCGGHPQPVYDPRTTVTIEIHGFNIDGIFPPNEVYGRDRDGSDLAEGIRRLTGLPDGTFEPSAPNQVLGTRYYGTQPPSYYTSRDVAEVEALQGIPRYALIVAKHADYVLRRSGATGVNFICHSMGGLVTRYLIERDVGDLMSRGKIVHWVTVAGVVTGADLARLFESPVDAAAAYGLHVVDIQHMNPTWVAENVSICDGSIREANSRAWQKLLIHHVVADDFTLDEILSLPLLEFVNIQRLANDAVLFTSEQQFHDQAPAARFFTRSGHRLKASVTNHGSDHFLIRENPGVHAAVVAALLGSRRVRVVLEELTLLDDHEKDSILDFGDWGFPPAEVVAESRVSWPQLESLVGSGTVVGERDLGGRAGPITQLFENETQTNLERVLYEAPVLDELDEIRFEIRFREADWFLAEGILENPFGPPATFLGGKVLDLPLIPQTFQLSLPGVVARVRVEIHDLY